MSDDEKTTLEKLNEAYEELQASDRGKFMQHIAKDLPSSGCEGQILGTVLGVWMSRGVCPDCLKRILGAMIDIIFLDLAESGGIAGQNHCNINHEEDDDDNGN
jgi:hypothetical protein